MLGAGFPVRETMRRDARLQEAQVRSWVPFGPVRELPASGEEDVPVREEGISGGILRCECGYVRLDVREDAELQHSSVPGAVPPWVVCGDM